MRLLIINEQGNGSISPALAGRLPDIQSWVANGGRLMIHDRSAGNLTPNPFLIGTPGLGTVRLESSNLNTVPPATTFVTAGPFGVIDDTTLDGGSSSAHGHVPPAALPLGSRAILGTGPDQIAAFSYPVGAGVVYYSTIPLDHYLPGGGGGAHAISGALTGIYTPNAITYLHELHPLLVILHPVVAANGSFSLYLANVDGTPIQASRLPWIDLRSTTDASQPIGAWSLLGNPKVLTNGLVRVDGFSVNASAGTFFRAVESP